MQSKTISFKGMPLFHKATFKEPFVMEGELKDVACFFYLVQGQMESYDVRGEHRIGEKDAIVKNCGHYIQKFVYASPDKPCIAIAIYLYPKLLKEIYKNEIPSFLKQEGVPQPKRIVQSKLVEQYMNNLSIYFEDPESLDEELGILKLKELILILLKSERHDSVRQILSEIFAPVNVAFKESIQQNLFNPVSISQLAYICNMSLSSFKRNFKKEFNESPAKYIKKKRLAHAANLLHSSKESISDVAFSCGFQDISTFSAVFHEHFKMTPSHYRTGQIRK